jgi:DNA-binding NarL/FixJ family response regulator
MCMKFAGQAINNAKNINLKNLYNPQFMIKKICLLCNGTGYVNKNPKVENILELHKKGLTYRQIGKLINLSHSTVFNHVKNHTI